MIKMVDEQLSAIDAASDEEIVFLGRAQHKPTMQITSKLSSTATQVASQEHNTSVKHLARPSTFVQKRKAKESSKLKSLSGDAISDYAENILANDAEQLFAAEMRMTARDLGGDNDWHSDSSVISQVSQEDGWSRAESPKLQGFVRRNRSVSDQTKCVPAAKVNQSNLAIRCVDEHIPKEANSATSANLIGSESRSSNSDKVKPGVDGSLSMENMEGVDGHRLSCSADEAMARLLAKQEELGIHENQLVLRDGLDCSESVDSASDTVVQHLRGQTMRSSILRNGRRRTQVNGHDGPSYPIDDDGFFLDGSSDLQHFSHMTKKQRRRADFALSDSELERNLRASWSKDRAKKKAQKREREELRMLGRLGRQGKKHSIPKNKYSNGMTVEEFKLELKAFLDSPAPSLALPPMHQHARRVVHETAHKLGLKSKSIGSGSDRFTTLIRTRRTLSYRESSLSGLQKGFFARPGRPRTGRIEPAKANKLAGLNNASFLNGEIVGAGAPELGEGNKGRAILEKMGWHTGSGLGAVNNQGIAVPVAHVVKTGKAGLG